MEEIEYNDGIEVFIANASHEKYVDQILDTISNAAKVRGTGIAKRTHEYVEEFAGFCYIESWGNRQYVANSGLIVREKFRGHGLARRIKQRAFMLSREKWPKAKLFGLTSGGAVMKINTELGYVPVPFSELTDDEAFWKGCQGCVNHDVLMRTDRRYCICTAMLYDPAKHKDGEKQNTCHLNKDEL